MTLSSAKSSLSNVITQDNIQQWRSEAHQNDTEQNDVEEYCLCENDM